jgi:hypothetical protein
MPRSSRCPAAAIATRSTRASSTARRAATRRSTSARAGRAASARACGWQTEDRRSYRRLMRWPVWGLYGGEALVATIRAESAQAARVLFIGAGLRGERVRRVAVARIPTLRPECTLVHHGKAAPDERTHVQGRIPAHERRRRQGMAGVAAHDVPALGHRLPDRPRRRLRRDDEGGHGQRVRGARPRSALRHGRRRDARAPHEAAPPAPLAGRARALPRLAAEVPREAAQALRGRRPCPHARLAHHHRLVGLASGRP